jgi:RNA polymerase sigma-70 factor (ECF subfamily)
VKVTVSEPLTQPTHPGASQQNAISSEAAENQPVDRPSLGSAPVEFSELYNQHSRAIYYLCLRFLSDQDKAEDATHDVFLKAFRKMGQFRGEASWRTWLYRIAINHCRNLQQAWNERHMLSNADETIFENAAARTDSPLRVLETKELGRRIQKALDGLPAEYRLILLLVADEQLSYEQVGALTEQSTDAVRGKLHRARKAFAALFEQTA